MAEEKTILTVDLYDNVLTEKTGDFTGKIRITGTTRTSDISNRIVKIRTEYRPETITNILDLSYDEMIEALAERYGTRVIESEIVGLSPSKALIDCAVFSLKAKDIDCKKQVMEYHLIDME